MFRDLEEEKEKTTLGEGKERRVGKKGKKKQYGKVQRAELSRQTTWITPCLRPGLRQVPWPL